VLFFFLRLHSDYHKPSDTWEKIDAAAAARVVNLVANAGLEIDEAPQKKPAFVTVVEPHSTGMGSGRGGGYGAYFGSIPDFGQVENGVRFSDVRPGSPAAQSGLESRRHTHPVFASCRSRTSTTLPTRCGEASPATR